RGEPDPAELAALVVGVSAASPRTATSARATTPTSRRGRWNDPSYAHRRGLRPGPGGWLAAARDH
ncbi:MAG: acyl-CoA carboxylase subunit epsilon, partial [Pseudonocardia sp.]|nr:acyl-CoA carboxylase subunit epsilon [Pseudonocardia sp.]